MIKKDFMQQIQVNDASYNFFDLRELAKKGVGNIDRLPYTIRILVENLLRKLDGKIVTEKDLTTITNWQKNYDQPVEIPYHPARVLMQDFTGVPAVVDIAALRDAVKDLGHDPAIVNPKVPVELVADHSVQVDFSGTHNSLTSNVSKEYERNGERYAVFKWAQSSFDNFKVVPPNSGICHQVNLEHLGRVTITEEDGETKIAYPDTVVGLDSHTTMINGIGVMGWGVGGIEAEAVMLGQPYYMSIPEVVGVRMVGKLKAGITATDLVLTLTELLRKAKVVEKFVEYFGPGMQNLSIPDRATISNMTPEYGATLGFFPIDDKTIEYLKLTGRNHHAAVTEAVAKGSGLFYEESDKREYTQVIEFDLNSVEPSLAGPARPQDRVPLSQMATAFKALSDRKLQKPIEFMMNNKAEKIGDGSVVIAAITSCTNTSNPHVLLGAGLIAKEAVKRGLKVPGYVKTSFAPGSKVVSNYLNQSGLMPYYEALGFHITAFGCTTCIGNSGPLNPELEQVITNNHLNVAAVLSGNRNFEARIHQKIQSNYLASPMLVLAFAIAGRVDIDLTSEPLSYDPNGEPVYLADLWPKAEEIQELVDKYVTQQAFLTEYKAIFDGDEFWKKLPVKEGTTYNWDPQSTYIKKPPYFDSFSLTPAAAKDIVDARTFLLLGDTVTTDHISPAGAIPEEYPAGQYLMEQGVNPVDFNSYGSRRGNHEVMMRGTFGNIRIKNKMIAPKEGAFTLKQPEMREMFNYDASVAYRNESIPLIVLAGKEYGTGSSRDWAAKGANLLGIRAVIAESFERIHRNNLVGMGLLPLVFKEGESIQSLGLTGTELFSIEGLADISPRKSLKVTAKREDGSTLDFEVTARLDTEVDVTYFLHGGILPYVLREMIKAD
ncbi:aconitate hydratase AcnA [Desulforhopalus sp. IMCC35007]|uniref:aconitate hydratase AcnA n=1 Tax=Desulforhopalus sp. IMCC35007 TaxID=2569543 RepID=UPI0010AEC1D9|nr:aconitate hydratase AcnA [Desulforhopalus sp. IMCC35007]TKB10051.1 aconitate hydratase AcnA [Desulforhopalus sp. IMCC35007]